MYLQCYINENGDKVYTTKKESPLGKATESAHPGKYAGLPLDFIKLQKPPQFKIKPKIALFSPDDKYSRQRILLKKRFGLLPTQQSPLKY